MADDALATLLAFKWRDVEFPITHMRMSIAHDLVDHKYWSVDGGNIEDTGVAPIRFTATIPLQNGTQPGTNERWEPQLYPHVMRSLVLAFVTRSTGILQHPEFGEIPCKAEHLDLNWEAARRGGCDAEASWIQTNDDDSTAQALATSPAANVEGAVIDLDNQMPDLRLLVPHTPVYHESFESALNTIAGIFDTVALDAKLAAGRINAIIYRANQVSDAIGRAHNALTWPATQAIEQLKSSAYDLQQKIHDIQGKTIMLFTVPADTTLAGVQNFLPKARITDLIQLNPSIVRDPLVKKGSVIRYYA